MVDLQGDKTLPPTVRMTDGIADVAIKSPTRERVFILQTVL
jgi:hypothetical protein